MYKFDQECLAWISMPTELWWSSSKFGLKKSRRPSELWWSSKFGWKNQEDHRRYIILKERVAFSNSSQNTRPVSWKQYSAQDDDGRAKHKPLLLRVILHSFCQELTVNTFFSFFTTLVAKLENCFWNFANCSVDSLLHKLKICRRGREVKASIPHSSGMGRRGFDPRQLRRTKRAFFPSLAIWNEAQSLFVLQHDLANCPRGEQGGHSWRSISGAGPNTTPSAPPDRNDQTAFTIPREHTPQYALTLPRILPPLMA